MIEIGDDCLFSWGISIRTGDHHTILQQGSHTILNKNKNIKIGDRVWVGSDVLILKGAEIPNDTVIGARSIVTKKFQETNTILAGTPAKVVKHNIEWATDNCFRYENNLCMT
ncbi:MAG: acyltransferase [Alphaproteobacteria bacterium]|nr:acyltransferase [Alphaproteobacteria bacterium]